MTQPPPKPTSHSHSQSQTRIPFHITPYTPSVHKHLIPSIADLHMATILHDNTVMRFHPPFTPMKRKQILEFWEDWLEVNGSGGEGVTLLALAEKGNGNVDGDGDASASPSATGFNDVDPYGTDDSTWGQGRNTTTTTTNDNPILTSAPTSKIEVAGVISLLTPTTAPDTGPFRASIEMLLIHPTYRRRHLAHTLMTHLEKLAYAKGRTMLTLSTTKGSVAEKMYESQRFNWVRIGEMRGYAWGVEGWKERERERERVRNERIEKGDDGEEKQKEDGEMGMKRVDGVLFYKDLTETMGRTRGSGDATSSSEL